MKSFASMIGWLLFLVALFVPIFLFYNWWSTNKKTEATLTSQVSGANTTIFANTREKTQASRPVASSLAIPQINATQRLDQKTGRPLPGQVNLPVPSLRTGIQVQPKYSLAPQTTIQKGIPTPMQANTIPNQLNKPLPAPVASTRTLLAPISGGVSISTMPAVKVAVSTQSQPVAAPPAVDKSSNPVTAYSPKSDRDPTMSPDDYMRIQEEEAARLEQERAAIMTEKKRKPVTIESKIALQGIIGNTAIVNGNMYGEGQTIRSLGIKIVKVGQNYVLFEFKGKKIRKILR